MELRLRHRRCRCLDVVVSNGGLCDRGNWGVSDDRQGGVFARLDFKRRRHQKKGFVKTEKTWQSEKKRV